MPSLVIKDIKDCWDLDDGRKICTVNVLDKKTKKKGTGVISFLTNLMIENNRSFNDFHKNSEKCDPKENPLCLLKDLEK